mmetsp:Transcript_40420/g.96863  ORF Transcript_40420/g.96863 Transcript_40420/m.96863 type:complete len:348 (+) Transcript_40420:322-1365(+)
MSHRVSISPSSSSNVSLRLAITVSLASAVINTWWPSAPLLLPAPPLLPAHVSSATRAAFMHSGMWRSWSNGSLGCSSACFFSACSIARSIGPESLLQSITCCFLKVASPSASLSVSTKRPSIAGVITATLVLTSFCGGGGRFSRLQESSAYGVDTLCIETAPVDCFLVVIDGGSALASVLTPDHTSPDSSSLKARSRRPSPMPSTPLRAVPTEAFPSSDFGSAPLNEYPSDVLTAEPPASRQPPAATIALSRAVLPWSGPPMTKRQLLMRVVSPPKSATPVAHSTYWRASESTIHRSSLVDWNAEYSACLDSPSSGLSHAQSTPVVRDTRWLLGSRSTSATVHVSRS